MTPDVLNGLFEFAGGLMIWTSVRRVLMDQEVKGVSSWSVFFFTCWGVWNLFFYRHLNQPWSLAGAVFMVSSNFVWLVMIAQVGWRGYQRALLMRRAVRQLSNHPEIFGLKSDWRERFHGQV